MSDFLGTCDWGDCDELAIALRDGGGDHGWLPVCAEHADLNRLMGRRLPDDHEFPDGTGRWFEERWGDYWKWRGIWHVYIPGGPVGTLPKHHVEEHEDGTITVEPGGGGISNSIPGHRFHGWIRRGVWSQS